LLDEEDIDPFMDDEIELVITVLINENKCLQFDCG
jgi:hypothetical protein